VGHQQHRFFASRIKPQTVWRIELSVSVAGTTNFAQKLAALRKAQDVMRTVPVRNIEIAIGSKGDIRRHKIDRPFGISRIFARIAVRPDSLSVERSFYDLAAVDIAVIQEFTVGFSAHAPT